MVAERIKDLVDARGIKYSFLADKTGIPIDAISKALRGKRRMTADEMLAICGVLGIDLGDLLMEQAYKVAESGNPSAG